MITIDITGPQGNAFNLIGIAMRLAQQLRLDEYAIREEMLSGSYEHLLATFNKYFGSVVELSGYDAEEAEETY